VSTVPTIKVAITYSEITPESAEKGDYSDSGFVEESRAVTFRELVDLIWREGFLAERGTAWLSTGFSVTDYRTGTEREECLHFSRENPQRLRKYWEAAIRAVERIRTARTLSH